MGGTAEAATEPASLLSEYRAPTWLRPLAEAAGVVVLLLPVIGVVGRGLTLLIDAGVPWDLRIAASVPLGELIALGVQPVLPVLLTLPALFLLERTVVPMRHTTRELADRVRKVRQRLDVEESGAREVQARLRENKLLLQELMTMPDPPESLVALAKARVVILEAEAGALMSYDKALEEVDSVEAAMKDLYTSAPAFVRGMLRWKRILFAIGFVLGIGSAVFLMLGRGWPTFHIGFVTGVLVFVVLNRITSGHKQISVRDFAPVVLTVLIGAVVALGAAASGFRGGYVTPVMSSAIEEGQYVEIGRSGDVIYLAPCSDLDTILAVPVTNVASIEYTRRPRASHSLLDVIRGDVRVLPSLDDFCTSLPVSRTDAS